MNTKKINLLLILFPLLGFAQHQIISGEVLDNNDKPIELANIILTDTINDKIISGTITGSDGKFQIKAKNGVYKLEISSLGFKTKFEILELGENINLHKVNMEPSNLLLDEVLIEKRNELIERKIDRTVFNVSKSVASIGGEGLDVLRVTPGVRINNSGINIVGKGSVRVLLDDRLMNLSGSDLINYLQSIPAENIERIEVITNPPSKYDAEGNTGLINIVTKNRSRDGFYGTITGRLNKATKLSRGLSSNLTYNNGGLNINATFGYNKSLPVGYYGLSVFYPNRTLKQVNDYSSNIDRFNENINLSYSISERTTIGANILATQSGIYNGRYDESSFFQGAAVDSLLNTQSDDDINVNNKAIALYMDHELDSLGSKITFETSYLDYKQDRDYQFVTKKIIPSENIEENLSPVSSINLRDINLLYALIDVTLKNDLGLFQFGGKTSFSITDNDSKYDNSNLDNAADSHFKYKENVYAGYLSFNKNVNDWSFKAGLRVEYTFTEGNSITLQEVVKNDYTKIFPTAFIKYDLNENHTFSATYGRRINRPNFSALDPFREYYSAFAYREGNPYLNPSYSDNFELIHNYKGRLNTSLYMNYVTNGYDFITISEVDSPNIATIRDNFLTSYSYGISENFSFAPFDWLESSNQLQAYYSEIYSSNPNTRSYLKGYGAYAYTNNNIVFSEENSIRGNFIFWYQFPEVYGVDEWEAYYGLNLGFAGNFLNDKMTLALNFNDILKTAGYSYDSEINDIPQTYYMYNDTRSVRFSVTYRFGTEKNKRNSRQVNDENRSRIN